MLGDGLFDTALVLGGRMVWRQAHMDRLLSGCRTLGFMLDVSRVQRAVDAALERCTFGALRVTVTRGGGPRGLAPPSDPMPTVLATIAPLNASVLFSPVSLHVSAIRRNETSPTSRLKSLAYLDGVLAARAALDAGFDDALFLNTSGKVACTTVGNVLAVVGGQLVTPPIDDGVLEGIARRKILETSDLLGLDAVERSIGLSDLDQADAVFVTNSLRLVAPVTAIDRKPFSGSLRGAALVTHVAKLVLEETGTDPRSLSSA